MQTLKMVDGSKLPGFIKLMDPREGYKNKKVHIYATEEDDVGFYELYI